MRPLDAQNGVVEPMASLKIGIVTRRVKIRQAGRRPRGLPHLGWDHSPRTRSRPRCIAKATNFSRSRPNTMPSTTCPTFRFDLGMREDKCGGPPDMTSTREQSRDLTSHHLRANC